MLDLHTWLTSETTPPRKEGGIMNSVTTFGDALSEDGSVKHTTQYLAGSGGTMLALLAGYFALKWTRRI